MACLYIRSKDDGTYSLQIGEMAKFRSTIDNNPAAKLNRYYTATGTSWGPVFQHYLWAGCICHHTVLMMDW